jgi:hypothetical protein
MQTRGVPSPIILRKPESAGAEVGWRELSCTRQRLPAGGTALFLGALLLSGCSADTTEQNQRVMDRQSSGYVDKGHGVFLINSHGLGGNPDAIANAFAQWRTDHPTIQLREILRLGTYNTHGALLLLTDEYFLSNTQSNQVTHPTP